MEKIKSFFSQTFRSNTIKEINLKNYTKLQLIGKGSFGSVFLIEDKKSHDRYAAKISTINDIQASKTFLREIDIFMKINHPTILQVKGYSLVDFNGEENPTLLTVYQPNGSLHNLLNLESRGLAPPEWDITRKYITIYGIARGMKYLHKEACIHRDLKPANILLTDRLFPQIADFGLAKWYNIEDSSDLSICGTPLYAAPEILSGQSTYDESIDVYSFGLIMYEVLTGRRPYDQFSKTPSLIPAKIIEGFRPEFPNNINITQTLKDLIQQCWNAERLDRPSFASIVETLKNTSIISALGVNVEEFENYQDIIDDDQVPATKLTDDYLDRSFSQIQKVNITSSKTQTFPTAYNHSIYPPSQLVFLSQKCQNLVMQAENGNSTFMVAVAQSLMKGINDFPKNIELAVKYLKCATDLNNFEAAELYASLLIKGTIIPQNYEMARGIVEKLILQETPHAQLLWAELELQNPNVNYQEVKQCLQNMSSNGSVEAMFLYAQLCILPKEKTNVDPNPIEARRYIDCIKHSGKEEIIIQAKQFVYDHRKILDPNQPTTPPPLYYPSCGNTSSIIDGLSSIGVDSGFSHRREIAIANGIENYRGTLEQNVYLLSLLKKGELIRE